MEQKIKCLNCNNDLVIYQPDDHTEYTPAGTCKNCGETYLFFIDIVDGSERLVGHLIYGEAE